MVCAGGGMSGADLDAVVTRDASALVAFGGTAEAQTFAGSQSHNRAIATGVMWQGGLRWLAQVLAWTATIAVARRLSPSDYGIAGTAGIISGFLLLVIDGGLSRAIVVMRATEPKLVAQVHTTACLLGAVLAGLMCLAAYPVSLVYREPRVAPVIVVLSLALVLNGATAIRVAVLQQRLEYRRVAQVEFSRSLTQALVVLVSAVGGLRYWSLAVGLLAGYAMGFGVARHFVRLPLARPSRVDVGPVVFYAAQLVASSLAWYIYSSADFAIVGRVAGLAALGYYQFGWNIAQLPGEKLANVLQAVVLPFFGSIGDDRKALRHYFLVLSELLLAVVLPVLAGFALLCPIAVPLIFGDRWIASIPSMQILVACAALSSVSLLSQHVLGATGQAIIALRLHVTAMLVMPPCFYIGARMGGMIGVAVVWLLFQPMLVGYPLLRLKSVIDLSLPEYLRNMTAPAISAVTMTVIVVLLQQFTSGLPPVAQIAILALIGAVSYSATYWVFFRPRVDRILGLWLDR
jgi:O-antigen/teichoic acid export membrane protein